VGKGENTLDIKEQKTQQSLCLTQTTDCGKAFNTGIALLRKAMRPSGHFLDED